MVHFGPSYIQSGRRKHHSGEHLRILLADRRGRSSFPLHIPEQRSNFRATGRSRWFENSQSDSCRNFHYRWEQIQIQRKAHARKCHPREFAALDGP
ncbi:hypothetical protein DPMN_076175 [Dreissena polymorpha]|uniref:Uncharacterized protein n=1 Tax=Dreissena polymorpha TaxID=45954 RepID=A0A9D4BQ94_DREPO|nr:hypothetical protein DPMN_076175 [Dreissena polymorpha]